MMKLRDADDANEITEMMQEVDSKGRVMDARPQTEKVIKKSTAIQFTAFSTSQATSRAIYTVRDLLDKVMYQREIIA